MKASQGARKSDYVEMLALKALLPTAITALKRRQANLLQDSLIEGLIAAGWLRWNGGALEATEDGLYVSEGLKKA